jgi:uncharacterized protein YjbI with pentapeptide repeats
LRDVFFRNADLSKANFKNADMRGSDLGGSNLHKANFTGANMEGVENIEYSENLATVKGLDKKARSK